MRRHPSLTCSRTPPQFTIIGDETCSPDRACRTADTDCSADKKNFDTYGGAPARGVTFHLAEDKVVGFSVRIHPNSYEGVREALKEVHGPGSEESRTLARNSGATFSSRMWISGAPNGITVREHAGRADEAGVEGSTTAFDEWKQKARRGEPSKNKRDL